MSEKRNFLREVSQTQMPIHHYAGDLSSINNAQIELILRRENLPDFSKQMEVVVSRVSAIIEAVSRDGDSGLKGIADKLGDKPPRQYILSEADAAALAKRLPQETKDILSAAAANIDKFASGIVAALHPVTIEFGDYSAGFELKPVARAACYVPGGRYPLPSTALMTAITARAARVKEVCIVSPVLCDEILYAGYLAGVSEFYELGGAQAVAAMALGTQTIRAADIVVGPGNVYVTEAKRQLFGQVGIDMLAGPSEVTIIADKGAQPEWLALDLLAQAEHDPDSRVYLLTDSQEMADAVNIELPALVSKLNLPDYISDVLRASAIIVAPTLKDCAELSNKIAPEHLELQVAKPEKLKPLVTNYGALFMGYHATVPFGDYMAGPNHTLPTNRAARFSGGLSPLTFLRGQSWLNLKGQARELATGTAAFAGLEGLMAHQAAAQARL